MAAREKRILGGEETTEDNIITVKKEYALSSNESDDEEGDEVHNICQGITSGTGKGQEVCEKRMLSPSPTTDPNRQYRCWKSTKVCHGDVATSEGKNQSRENSEIGQGIKSEPLGTAIGATHSKECKVMFRVLQDIGDEAAGSSSGNATQFVPIADRVSMKQEVCDRDDSTNKSTQDSRIGQGIKTEPLGKSTIKSEHPGSPSVWVGVPIPESSTVLQPLHINELPTLLMSKILSYLTMNQLLCTASLVCKLWYRAAREPGLWKRIVLDRSGISDADLYYVVRINRNVSQLHIVDCRLLTGASVAKALVICSSLKELVIMRCNQLHAEAFCDIGPNCRDLRKVNFSNSVGVSDEAIENIAAHCPNLAELRLNHCSYISDASIQKIAKGCPKLRTLTFQENKRITDLSLKAICDHSTNMEVLSLHKCAITNQGITDLHKLKKLCSLDLSNITSLSPHSVADAISAIPQLETLNLCLSKHINDNCVRCIAASCKKLKYLFLVSCNISDEGLISIGRNSRTIEHIDVGWCRDITDHGVTALSQMCPQLKYLGMVRCDKLTEACVTWLVEQYPHIHYSTFLLDSQRLLEKAKQQGYLTYNV